MDSLTESEVAEAEKLTTQLIENAEAVHMHREDIVPSVKFYLATKKALHADGADGFVIPRFEVCAKQVMET